MTMRSWALLILVGLFLLIFTQVNAQELSVWDQMSSGASVNHDEKTQIQEVQIRSDQVVLVKIQNSNGNSESVRLCADTSGTGHNSPQSAALLNQQIEILRDSIRTKQSVKLEIRGPWSPCIASVTF